VAWDASPTRDLECLNLWLLAVDTGSFPDRENGGRGKGTGSSPVEFQLERILLRGKGT
jgi:hypothetical protein